MPQRVTELFSAFKGFEKDAKRLVWVSVVAAISDAFVWFLLTLYLDSLGYSEVELGSVIFAMSISSTLPLLLFGYISDRFGRRRMIFLGVILRVVGLGVLAGADSLTDFYLGASVWGLGHATYVPAFMGFLSEKVEEQRRKFLFGFQMFGSMIASASTVLVAGMLPDFLSSSYNWSLHESYSVIFLISLWFCLLQLFPLMLTRDTPSAESRFRIKSRSNEKKSLPPVPRGTLLMLCIPMALLGLGAGLVIPFFQVYFRWRFDTSIQDIGILFSLTQFLWAGAYLLMPNVAERRGSVSAITTVHAGAIVALVAIPISPNFYFVAVAYITRMVLMNSTWPIFQSYSLSQVPKEHRSLTLSATDFSFNVMKAITPLAGGFLFAQSLELPFFITALLYTIATITFFLFFRKRDDRSVINSNGSTLPVHDSKETRSR
ncbi:MAG: MFS transporter [Thermoplasmata archaeon]|nr:MAG: MFS transporter [Thermoplasmata archaeon]